ncbi:MAG: stalk domain-containing protein [Oscillospiraceae bacterium]|nr:stalk domain-containing protein [Oscillospiraceae bacterium]
MFKKSMLALSLLLAFIACASQTINAAAPISVVLDGKTVHFDVEPEMIEFRTMVPMRAIFEALDSFIEWDGDTMTVTAYRYETVVVAAIGNKTMTVDSKPMEMDVAPILKDSRTLVPVRFVSEAFGCDVKWDENTSIVYINSPQESGPVTEYDSDYYETIENQVDVDYVESYEDFYSQGYPITGLAGEQNGDTVKISWNAAAGADNYEVQWRSTKTSNEWINDYYYLDNESTSYISRDKEDLRMYSFRVRAIADGMPYFWSPVYTYVHGIEPTTQPIQTQAPGPSPTPAPQPAQSFTPQPAPMPAPLPSPTAVPTSAPLPSPTAVPTQAPLPSPTAIPTQAPLPSPTVVPTQAPLPTPTPENRFDPAPLGINASANRTSGTIYDRYTYTVKITEAAKSISYSFNGNPTIYTLYADGSNNFNSGSGSVSEDKKTWIWADDSLGAGNRVITITIYFENREPSQATLNITVFDATAEPLPETTSPPAPTPTPPSSLDPIALGISASANRTSGTTSDRYTYTVKTTFTASKITFSFNGNSTLYTLNADGSNNFNSGTGNVTDGGKTWTWANDTLGAGNRVITVTAYAADGKSISTTINITVFNATATLL